jgi:ubiquinone/menaquinone biosynthesis C-methylase UbiE
MVQLYRRPGEYELEHLGDDDDIQFYVNLSRSLKPQRILELACGTGRITIPLAEEGARSGYSVVGLDTEPAMLKQASQKLRGMPAAIRKRIKLVEGDMRTWRDRKLFNLIIIPCSSISHVLELRDQLAIWDRAFQNLSPGGRFVVETTMPNFAAYADSFANPPRAMVEIDRDVSDTRTGTRLLRHRTVTYMPAEQRAQIRFLYEKYRGKNRVDRYLDDFESHVYFPRELQLLFMHAGFEIESVYGDYTRRPLRSTSQQMIVIGLKPTRSLTEPR